LRTARRKLSLIAGLCITLLDAGTAYAEVMDKEPSIIQHWLTALVLGIAALPAWRCGGGWV
jgi:hypothetical protein